MIITLFLKNVIKTCELKSVLQACSKWNGEVVKFVELCKILNYEIMSYHKSISRQVRLHLILKEFPFKKLKSIIFNIFIFRFWTVTGLLAKMTKRKLLFAFNKLLQPRLLTCAGSPIRSRSYPDPTTPKFWEKVNWPPSKRRITILLWPILDFL